MKQHDSKIKQVLKIADDFLLDLRQTATNPVIEQLEASMQLREMSLEQHVANRGLASMLGNARKSNEFPEHFRQLRKSKKLPEAKH